MNTQEALKMAITQFERIDKEYDCTEIIDICKEALAQPAQEPVAFTNSDELSELQSGMTTCYMYKQAIDDDDIALYTHPCVLMHSAPVQEPVAWIEVTTHHEKYQTSKVILLDKGIKLPHDTLLYTHPALAIEQEPVAWIRDWADGSKDIVPANYESSYPVYGHPAPPCQECENLKHDLEGYMEANKALINREWQGLSDDEIVARVFENEELLNRILYLNGVSKGLEQALKEKKT